MVLHLSEVQELSRLFKSLHPFSLERGPGLLEVLGVTLFSRGQFVLVLLLGSGKLVVPVLVEFLVLLDVGPFALLLLLLVHENEFFVLLSELLVFQLGDPVLSHFSLDIASVAFHLVTVVFHRTASQTNHY